MDLSLLTAPMVSSTRRVGLGPVMVYRAAARSLSTELLSQSVNPPSVSSRLSALSARWTVASPGGWLAPRLEPLATTLAAAMLESLLATTLAEAISAGAGATAKEKANAPVEAEVQETPPRPSPPWRAPVADQEHQLATSPLLCLADGIQSSLAEGALRDDEEERRRTEPVRTGLGEAELWSADFPAGGLLLLSELLCELLWGWAELPPKVERAEKVSTAFTASASRRNSPASRWDVRSETGVPAAPACTEKEELPEGGDSDFKNESGFWWSSEGG